MKHMLILPVGAWIYDRVFSCVGREFRGGGPLQGAKPVFN